MSVLKRCKNIMASNINALLDKCEDPKKMSEQKLKDLERGLDQVKLETAGVMADADGAKKKCEDNNREIEQMLAYAEKAIKAGNDQDAAQFVAKKQQLENLQISYEEQYKIAKENADKMRMMHDELSAEIRTAHDRVDMIVTKTAIAKTQEKINEVSNNTSSLTASVSDIGRWEDKTDKRLGTARAVSELNSSEDTVEKLKGKYGSIGVYDESVVMELEALKHKVATEPAL